MKILIVDDAQEIEKMVLAVFKRRGFDQVTFVCSPAEAVEKIKVLQPDVMFLDINLNMENFDGFDLFQQLKPLSPLTKFIMLSAYTEFAEKAKTLGVDGFLAKPTTVEKMIGVVNEVVGAKES